MRNQAATFNDDLLDISDLSRPDFDSLAGTTLGQALVEALRSASDGAPYAGFNSSLPSRER